MAKFLIFPKLCKQFHQDIGLVASSRADLMAVVMQALSASERLQLRDELNRLLGSEFNDKQLLDVWNASPAQVYFKSAEDLRSMLSHVLEHIR
jgi:hypothetical protein